MDLEEYLYRNKAKKGMVSRYLPLRRRVMRLIFMPCHMAIKLDNYPAGGSEGYTHTAERAVNK